MTHSNTDYKGFTIQKRTDVKNNSCIIFNGEKMVKCIAGSISTDGSENSIEKAKQWIDQNLN